MECTCVKIIAIFNEQSGEADELKEASSTLPEQRQNDHKFLMQKECISLGCDEITHKNKIWERFSRNDICLDTET